MLFSNSSAEFIYRKWRFDSLCSKYHKSCCDCPTGASAFHSTTKIAGNSCCKIFIQTKLLSINPKDGLRTIVDHWSCISKLYCFFYVFVHCKASFLKCFVFLLLLFYSKIHWREYINFLILDLNQYIPLRIHYYDYILPSQQGIHYPIL